MEYIEGAQAVRCSSCKLVWGIWRKNKPCVTCEKEHFRGALQEAAGVVSFWDLESGAYPPMRLKERLARQKKLGEMLLVSAGEK
ncbi:MAG: hypothetical protein WC766_06215 [Patescibacteria group bacterium]